MNEFFFFMKIQSNIHYVLTKYQQIKRHIITIFWYIAMQLSNEMKVDFFFKLLKYFMIDFVLNVATNKSYVYYLIICTIIS